MAMMASTSRIQNITPMTPPRYTSSPDGRGPGDSLFAGDSPLPSPPSITRPSTVQRSHIDGRLKRTEPTQHGDDTGHHAALIAKSDQAEARQQPTTAPLIHEWRSRRPESEDHSPHYSNTNHAKTLAASMGASPPPLKSTIPLINTSASDRPTLESKFGIGPSRPSTRPRLPTHGRAVSHTVARAASEEQQEQPNPSRPASSGVRNVAFSTSSEARVVKVAPHNSEEVRDSTSRPGSSLAPRSREASRDYKIAEVALASGARVSRKRLVLESNDIVRNTRENPERGAALQSEIVHVDQDGEMKKAYNGKSSAGSDSAPSSSSLPQQDNSAGSCGKGTHSGSSREDKPFAYVTPALATGGRYMRSSQTATGGRSAGRTLRRPAMGEPRPAHARAVRVMVPQGAVESEGEEEEEEEAPGIALGGEAIASVPPVESETRSDKLPSPPIARLTRTADQGSPTPRQATSDRSPQIDHPLQSASNFLDGLSLRARHREPPDLEHHNVEYPQSEKAAHEVHVHHEGRRMAPVEQAGPQREIKVVSPPPMPLGADEDEEEEEEDGQAKEISRARPPPHRNEAFPFPRRADGLHLSRPGLKLGEDVRVSSKVEDKENLAIRSRAAVAAAAFRKDLQNIMHAKVPPPLLNNGGDLAVVNHRSSAALGRQPFAIQSRVPNFTTCPEPQELLPTAVDPPPQTPAAPAAAVHPSTVTAPPRIPQALPPSPLSTPADKYDFARLEPEIEAEKIRLLELNGWDPWIQAVFEEAQRQRYNGSSFGENLVGKPLPSRKDTKFRGCRYIKVSKAGDGGFSSVFQVLGPATIPGINGPEAVPSELQGWFAMKQVTLKGLEQSSRDGLLREAELLANMSQLENSDRYLVRYFGHKYSGETLKMVMELGESDFSRHLVAHHPLPRQALSNFYQQMLASVHFVHSAGLLHTDLKPANFLMIQGRIKIIDFGIAEKVPIGTLHIRRDNIVGTPNYMAPETIQQKGAEQEGCVAYKTGAPADVWSLGCILYQMVYGKTPFADYSGPAKLKAITNRHHEIAFPLKRHPDCDGEGDPAVEEVDEILLDCLKSALRYNAEERANLPTLLEHAFVKDDVTLERRKLKKIVMRIHTYMQQGNLTEDNLEEMADRLMTNLQLESFRPFCAG